MHRNGNDVEWLLLFGAGYVPWQPTGPAYSAGVSGGAGLLGGKGHQSTDFGAGGLPTISNPDGDCGIDPSAIGIGKAGGEFADDAPQLLHIAGSAVSFTTEDRLRPQRHLTGTAHWCNQHGLPRCLGTYWPVWSDC